jgi:predicted DNA-binding WGR domain protein
MADGVLLDEAQCRYIGAQTVQRCSGTLQLQSSAFAASPNLNTAQEFGDADLIRESGRIGTAGEPRINLHDSEGAAVEVLEIWLRRKQRRGYVTRPD